MSAVEPIMVRAKITQDEWLRLRKLALDAGEPVSSIIGRLIREHLDGKGRGKRS